MAPSEHGSRQPLTVSAADSLHLKGVPLPYLVGHTVCSSSCDASCLFCVPDYSPVGLSLTTILIVHRDVLLLPSIG